MKKLLFVLQLFALLANPPLSGQSSNRQQPCMDDYDESSVSLNLLSPLSPGRAYLELGYEHKFLAHMSVASEIGYKMEAFKIFNLSPEREKGTYFRFRTAARHYLRGKNRHNSFSKYVGVELFVKPEWFERTDDWLSTADGKVVRYDFANIRRTDLGIGVTMGKKFRLFKNAYLELSTSVGTRNSRVRHRNVFNPRITETEDVVIREPFLKRFFPGMDDARREGNALSGYLNFNLRYVHSLQSVCRP